MAKSDPEIRPLTEIVPIFRASLEAYMKSAMLLHQAIEAALALKQVNPEFANLLKARSDDFQKHWSGEKWEGPQ